MTELLEYVNKQTVLLRHPSMEPTISRFFADAGENSVRAFIADQRSGYVFYVRSSNDAGRFFKLVTVDFYVGPESEERRMRFERQFTHCEWFTGSFRGRLDTVTALDITEETGI